MKNKLHCCCGEVYLENYVNVDVYIENYTFLAKDVEDYILNINKTTMSNYHKYPLGQNPIKKSIIDDIVDITKWPYEKEMFNEIIIVNSFEHFTKNESENLINNFYNSLTHGGFVYIDVPNIEEIMELLKNNIITNDFAMRHIYGSYKNQFNLHKYGYTMKSLTDLLEKYNFKNVKYSNMIKHCYPIIAVTAEK